MGLPTVPQQSERGTVIVLAFSVAPSGTGCEDGPVHDAVAAAANVVRDSGSPNTTSSLFAETEGARDEGVGMVKRATEAVEPFSSRISLVSKVDVRPGCGGEPVAKVERFEHKIEVRRG
ncbi:thiamine-binding protein [Brevibacterium aurantiacum]|uniref:Uncharacterized conserved protein YqgV, UPF0045/DUF77 family n=1 Tax=Brevibacterium aurantiacum TaxID=273384 RepID=A0A2H1JZP7_BREAU|nr:thiamine-binding protein [Brevibacterium aurantiacum]GEB21946.1 hypothetical protein BAU01nite_06790 [Brevibacterium aurantiacum]SMX92966.1 Uncharacterized conserved protein YqgV, UPF0045/DUF77 family [Brevibacterium aurantiacum]